MNKSSKKSSRRTQRGAALLLVLFAMTVSAAILSLALPAAQIAYLSSESHNDRILNFYMAESALSRAQIMMINDLMGYKDRSTLKQYLSEKSNDEYVKENEEKNETRYTADGTDHTLVWRSADDIIAECSFVIDDALSNYNFSGGEAELMRRLPSYGESFTITDSEDAKENFKIMTAQILDYVDANDEIREDGLEAGDYENSLYNLPNLPRNGPIETVEELFLIPMVAQMVAKFDDNGLPTNIRVGLTPSLYKKFSSLQNKGNASLASSSGDYIRSMLGRTVRDNDELDKLSGALNDFRSSGTAFYDNLEADDISKLQKDFSMEESGLYTITVSGASNRYPSERKIRASFVMSPSAQPNDNFCYILHRFYWITY